MKFLSRIGAAWNVLRSGGGGGPAATAWFRGENYSSGALTNALEQSTWVYACSNFLSRTVASLPYRVSDGDRVLEKHPVIDLFNQPHRYLTSSDLWEHCALWLLLRGRCFVAGLDASGNYIPLIGGRAKLPDSLVVIPADRVTPKHSSQVLLGWRYFAGHYDLTPSHNFVPDELIHIACPNPFDFWGGLSPLTVAILAASTDRAAALFQRGLAESNGELGCLVTSEHQLTDPQINQVKAALAERRRGAGVAARPLFLPNGAKVEKPAISSADAQFLENRQWSRQEICAIFGVPEALLGFVEDVNRANGSEQHDSFIFNTLAPLVSRIDAGFSRIAKSAGVTARHDVGAHPIMQAARLRRLDAGVKACSIGVPFNEANRVLDLGFKEQPWGNTWYKPFSLEDVAAPQPEVPAAPTPAPPAKEVGADPFARLASLLSAPPAHECRGSDAFAKSIRAAVSRLHRRMSREFFNQRGRVLAKLAEKNKAVSGPMQRALADEIWDADAEDRSLEESLSKLLADDFAFGGAQIGKELGLTDFALAPERARAFLATRKNAIKGINDTTFEAIKSQLDEALKLGESYADMADRVREVFSDATQRRAETIAQTETGIAVNSGRFAGIQESGATYKMWLSSNLETTRPAHEAAGQTYDEEGAIPVGDTFLVGGDDLDHPGDPKGSPDNVINCRCTVLPVLSEAKGAPRCGRAVEFLDYRSFRGPPQTP